MSFVSKSKFAKRADTEQANVAASAFAMVSTLRSQGSLSGNSEIGAVLVSNESFSSAQESQASEMLTGLMTSVEAFALQNPMFGSHAVTEQQKEAVGFALASAMNPRAHITRIGDKAQHKNTAFDVYIPDHSGVDPKKLGQKSLEAYDTKPNDETLNFTAAFALATASQNRFGEMFYKTVNLSPDQYAIEMEIPLITVHEQVRYELEQRLVDFKKRNIVNAEIDHTILKNDTLKIVPIVRAQTADAFVDSALIAPYAVTLEDGTSVQTSALKTNWRGSLFRVAQTDAQLAKGVLDQTDALDPGAVLTGVYVQFGAGANAEVVRIDTRNSPLNQFTE